MTEPSIANLKTLEWSAYLAGMIIEKCLIEESLIKEKEQAEAGKVELENIDFNLRSAVESAVIPLSVRANEKGLDINILLRSEVPQCVKGDPTRIKQIITNLVSNAMLKKVAEITLGNIKKILI